MQCSSDSDSVEIVTESDESVKRKKEINKYIKQKTVLNEILEETEDRTCGIVFIRL